VVLVGGVTLDVLEVILGVLQKCKKIYGCCNIIKFQFFYLNNILYNNIINVVS
jgi:hypothetical protein